jgi:hypothetical protein
MNQDPFAVVLRFLHDIVWPPSGPSDLPFWLWASLIAPPQNPPFLYRIFPHTPSRVLNSSLSLLLNESLRLPADELLVTATPIDVPRPPSLLATGAQNPPSGAWLHAARHGAARHHLRAWV